MTVGELIEKLKKERDDEEVVFVFDENRFEYYRPEFKSFLHAGPEAFVDEDGFSRVRSVVMIAIKKRKA
jgi:hypothetical protein